MTRLSAFVARHRLGLRIVPSSLALTVALVSQLATAEMAPPSDTVSAPAMSSSEEDGHPYRVAFGVGAAAGAAQWGTEPGILRELNARYQPLSWLGVGATYFDLYAPNNESYPTFEARALEVNTAFHPLGYSWLDPYARLSGVWFAGFTGEGSEDTAPLGIEVLAGMNVALPYVAFGLNLRHGFTNRSWTLLGLQVEGRI